jgi:tetratricopeptide (TPR) repeat protein
MSVGVVRGLIVTAASLIWLVGCETTSKQTDPSQSLASANPSADPTTTGSFLDPSTTPVSPGAPPSNPELLGNDPNDDLSIGKKYFLQGSYGLAERHFRKAAETHPKDAETWVGLAAAYDRLRRFDLADRAYGQAINILGQTPEIMNNQGFSYMLRGDYKRARSILLAAQSRDPENPYIKNNLHLLGQSARKAKAVN